MCSPHHRLKSDPLEDFLEVVLPAVPYILEHCIHDAVSHRQRNPKHQDNIEHPTDHKRDYPLPALKLMIFEAQPQHEYEVADGVASQHQAGKVEWKQ